MSCAVSFSRGLSPLGIYSVWRRYAHVYRKTWLVNCLPPMSEPVVYLIAFGLGLSPLIPSVSYLGAEVAYLNFIAPGMIAVSVMYQSFFEGAYGPFVRFKFQRTWQALLTTPLSFGDIFAAELFWAATKGMIGGLSTGAIALLWGIYSWKSMVFALPLLAVGSLIFAAAGMLTAGIAKTVNHINIPVFTFIVPMFVLSGTYFPRNNLPGILGNVASLLPLSGLVDLLRWELAQPKNIFFSLGLLLVWGLIFLALAWIKLHGRVFK